MSKEVALVLASGGARGLAQIGAIEELEKRGYHIHSIAGASMGAVIGGVYACGKMPEFSKWMRSLDKSDVFRLLDFTFSLGFVKSERVYSHIQEIIGNPNIEDFETDLKIIATDIAEEREFIFSKGSLIEAMRASTAYPTIITPAVYKGKYLVDGGVLNPLPLNRVQRKEGDILVSVDLGARIPYHNPYHKKEKKNNHQTAFGMAQKTFRKYFQGKSEKEVHEKWNYFKLVSQTINLMHNQLNQLATQYYTPDINVQISYKAAETFDFYKAKELIEYGRIQAIEAINEYEKAL